MKKSFIITLMLALVSTLSFGQNASQARSILDKAASVIGRREAQRPTSPSQESMVILVEPLQ